MKAKKWIIAIVLVVVLAVSGVIIYLFNPPNGNEIIFVGYQYLMPTAEDEEDSRVFILINRKGQYTVLSRKELLSKGKSIMEEKEYYSNHKYHVDGTILNPIDMYLCCKWLKKVDTTLGDETEYLSTNDDSVYIMGGYFLITACDILQPNIDDSEQKSNGVSLYDVNFIHSIQVDYLNDPYAKKIINKLLKNWPIKNGEPYIEREKWLE